MTILRRHGARTHRPTAVLGAVAAVLLAPSGARSTGAQDLVPAPVIASGGADEAAGLDPGITAPVPQQQEGLYSEKGAVRVLADRTAYDPGGTAEIAVVLAIEPGWHVNSHVPSYPELIGTEVRFDAPAGWAPPETPRYPRGEMKSFGFVDEPISVYEGEAVIRSRLAVPPDAEPGTYPVRTTVTYQACDDRMCLPPVTTEATLPITVGPGGEATGAAPFGAGGRAGTPAGGGPGAATPGESTGGGSVLWILALGFVGGLILNAMPCVLPVLSLKLFGLVKSAGGGGGAVAAGGLATAAGILLSFWALAAAAVAARAAGVAVGWGIQFQEPVFVAALSVIVLLFTLNLWGLFEIPVPRLASRVGMSGPREGLPGHLATGFFATLMATPCSAPFLGTALGFALTQSAAMTFGTFSAIGLGMASPYLLLAAFPGAGRLLPRPGPWMVTFRVVMGFLLAATVVWLLYVMAGLVGPARLAFFELTLLGIALVLWLRSRGAGATAPARAAAVAVLVLAGVGIAIAAGADGEPRAAGIAPEDRLIAWVPFDRRRAEREAERGRPVFVDVTADWCFTCKVNERLFLETPEVAEAFERHDVLAMRADWTRRDESIGEYLADFGRYGIPFYVLYRPGREPHVFSELLSKRAILDRLEEATADEGRPRDRNAEPATDGARPEEASERAGLSAPPPERGPGRR